MTVSEDTLKVLTPDNVKSFAGLRIVPVREITSQGLCLGLYGRGGTGKTTTACQIVKSKSVRNVLLCDVEAGASAVAHLNNVEVASIQRWQDAIAIGKEYERLKPGDDLPFDAIVWDNISELQNKNIESIVPPGTPIEIQHWGKSTADILRFTRFWRDQSRRLGVHVVFCGWEEREKDEERGLYTSGIVLTKKLADQWPGVITMIGLISPIDSGAARGKRRLSFTASNRTDAKFRVAPTEAAAAIPLELIYGRDDPVLADILDTIRGDSKWPVERYAPPKAQQG